MKTFFHENVLRYYLKLSEKIYFLRTDPNGDILACPKSNRLN